MNPEIWLSIICVVLFFIVLVIIFRPVSKLKPPGPGVFYLLDIACYKSPYKGLHPTAVLENQHDIYTSPNVIENVVFEMVDALLSKTKANVKDIGVLVCVFKGSSAVSLTSIIAKKYKLNENIISYDLNAKECTSELTGIILAKQLLQVKHNSCALVLITEELPESSHVSTEIQTDSSLIEYRSSGAAILLSNRSCDFPTSKYKLIGTHNVQVAVSDGPSSDLRTQASSTDLGSHTSVNDSESHGSNITVIDEHTLASEQVVRSNVAFVTSLNLHPDQPRFKMCQVSGEAMVGAVERNQKVRGYIPAANRMVPSTFGYTPNTIMWYKFAIWDANWMRIDKGDCTAQMAVWSDWPHFKGSTLVWESTRDIFRQEKKMNPMV